MKRFEVWLQNIWILVCATHAIQQLHLADTLPETSSSYLYFFCNLIAFEVGRKLVEKMLIKVSKLIMEVLFKSSATKISSTSLK